MLFSTDSACGRFIRAFEAWQHFQDLLRYTYRGIYSRTDKNIAHRDNKIINNDDRKVVCFVSDMTLLLKPWREVTGGDGNWLVSSWRFCS